MKKKRGFKIPEIVIPVSPIDITEDQKSNRQFVLKAVSTDGWLLHKASPDLQNDREVVLAAVRNQGRSLKYASPDIQNNLGFLKLIAGCCLEIELTLKNLSVQIAKQLANLKVDIYLPNVESISDLCSEYFAAHDGYLELGLISISNIASKALSQHKKRVLLPKILFLSDQTYFYFCNSPSNVGVRGAYAFDDSPKGQQEEYLSGNFIRCWFRIDESFSLLSGMPTGFWDIECVTEITDKAAFALSLHKGDLSLDGLSRISEKSAEALSNHKGILSLNGLTDLSETSAIFLSQHMGELYLYGLQYPLEKHLRSLMTPKGTVHLSADEIGNFPTFRSKNTQYLADLFGLDHVDIGCSLNNIKNLRLEGAGNSHEAFNECIRNIEKIAKEEGFSVTREEIIILIFQASKVWAWRSGEAYPETPLWVLGRAWASVRLFAENNLNFE